MSVFANLIKKKTAGSLKQKHIVHEVTQILDTDNVRLFSNALLKWFCSTVGIR